MVYGGPVQYGFLNYTLGVGLSLVAFAAYLRWRLKPLWFMLAVFMPMCVVLLLCHLAALALLGLAIAGFETAEAFKMRPLRVGLWHLTRAGLRAAAFALPPLIFFMVEAPKDEFVDAIYGGLHAKLDAIAAITLFSAPGIELTILAIGGAALGLAVVTGVVRVTRAAIGITVPMVLLFLAVPRHGMGVGYIDYRLPWAISLFALATCVSTRTRPRWGLALGCVGAALALVRIGALTAMWVSWEPIIAGVDRALSSLPRGTRLMVVTAENSSTSAGRRPGSGHFGAYAVARRQAYMPQMFANIPGQVLQFTPAYNHKWELSPTNLDYIPPGYDYVLVLDSSFARIAPDLPIKCDRAGPIFELYEILPPGSKEDLTGCRPAQGKTAAVSP